MKAEKPQSHSTYSQECSKQLSSQEDETPNPQPRSSHLGCPHAVPPHTTPLSHSPVQATRGLHSFSCPWIVTEVHGPAPDGCWGPGCSHTCCFHLSSANSYPGPTMCQAPFRVPWASLWLFLLGDSVCFPPSFGALVGGCTMTLLLRTV